MRAAPDVALVSVYPVADGDHGGSSGVAWYTRQLARGLDGQGAAVTVIAQEEPGEPERSTDGGVTVERRFRRGPNAVPAAARAAAATGAPIVHVQHEMFLYGGPAAIPGLVAGLGGLLRAGRGPVVTLHQVIEPASVDRAFTAMHRVSVPAPVARAGIRAVQGTVSRLAAATVVHEQAFRPVVPRSVVVPFGIDLVDTDSSQSRQSRQSRDPDPDQAGYRHALGLRPGALTVLCFGFIAPYKGLETALEAAALAGPQVQMVVAGAEHPRLAGSGYAAGLRDRFGHAARFTGPVPERAVPEWFAAADVALLLYPRPFSSSGVLSVALSRGTPVLLSTPLAASIGAPEVLAVNPDSRALADRLTSLHLDPARLAELHRQSDALARGRSWSTVAARHLELYQEVTHSYGPSGR